jgi:hypothetical protein
MMMGTVGIELAQALFGAAGRHDGGAGPGEHQLQQFDDLGIVIDHKDLAVLQGAVHCVSRSQRYGYDLHGRSGFRRAP